MYLNMYCIPMTRRHYYRAVRLRAWRVLLLCLIGLATLNLWTGGPLLALWIGSRTQGDGPTSMTAVFVVAIVLAAVSLGLIKVIAQLQAAYRKQGGEMPQVRAHTPWLRSMRGERPLYPGESARVTAPERILVVVVVVAIALFELWFFFLSGSPIDQRSGRGERVLQVAALEGPAPHGSITLRGSGWSSFGAWL